MVTNLFNGLLDSYLIVDSHHRQHGGVRTYGGLQQLNTETKKSSFWRHSVFSEVFLLIRHRYLQVQQSILLNRQVRDAETLRLQNPTRV